MRTLVTGATGYIGGRLVPGCSPRATRSRAMTRSAGRLRDVPWAPRSRWSRPTRSTPTSLPTRVDGVDVAYYLIHSIGTRPTFEDTDRQAAQAFADAAREARCRADRLPRRPRAAAPAELSPHLRSRAEVGRILLDSGVPTACCRRR